MTIRRKGLIRLWIVLSVFWTVGWSFYAFAELARGWAAADKISYEICFDSTMREGNETSDQCLDREGVKKSIFEREHTTALVWWSEALGISFVMDLVLTVLLVGLFYVVRWIARGFRSDSTDGGA